MEFIYYAIIDSHEQESNFILNGFDVSRKYSLGGAIYF